ncbi:alkaline phosphatase D family protein [Flammeovirgaceae bacterium SG7u.111]|nr:alkaline phosphatase D family protein [Flammeovirgaceae bacterium SG7u.132]WPO35395.1 alkaline phosphatase D family protein [Flammeovirgaceae bacterium SG7u.111]
MGIKIYYSFLTILFIAFGCQVESEESKSKIPKNDTYKYFDEELKPFYHGVASGDPLPTRVIIWTRVTPEIAESVEVEWQVAEDMNFSKVIKSGKVATDSLVDYTVKVDVSGLSPATTYFYRFTSLGKTSIIGKTMTSNQSLTEPLKFAIVSCSNYEAGFYNAYARIAEKEVNAVIHLGDYIYEYAPKVYGDSTTGRFHLPAHEIVTLEDYRIRYAQYRLDKDLMKVHQKHPFITIWDDHEIANNVYKDGAENHQDDEGDFLARKAAARKAYYEWMPIRESKTLYRRFDFGPLANLLMLDERLERSKPADSLQATEYLDESRSMLGSEQYKWLTQNLKSSQATWNLIGNQVIFADLNMSPIYPQSPRNLDSWDGFPIEKQKLLSFLDSSSIKNTIFLTGDTHSSWAFEVPSEQKRYNKGAKIVALEFGTTSITSSNSNEYTTDDSVKMAEKILLAPSLNPHLKFTNLRDHGYLLLTLTQEDLTADWYYVSTVKKRSNEEMLAYKIVVKNNELNLQQ